MLQVFSNLIANGIDAMKEGGRLFISLRKTTAVHGDGIQTVISDDGIGISPENLQRIFEPFFTTKGNLGTGIGLWVTKQLVEGRGGQIGVSSNTEPGKSGTRVTIFIPFATPKKPELMKPQETISEP
jgi:signal transduction histidine kinase